MKDPEAERGKTPDHDTSDVVREDTGKALTRDQLSNFTRYGTYEAPVPERKTP